ncbi:MAG: hypothetical protein ACYTHM_08305 [Planctomycetota bacterium]
MGAWKGIGGDPAAARGCGRGGCREETEAHRGIGGRAGGGCTGVKAVWDGGCPPNATPGFKGSFRCGIDRATGRRAVGDGEGCRCVAGISREGEVPGSFRL